MPYPEKPALNNYPINELIKKRWSPRLFADQPIEPEKMGKLVIKRPGKKWLVAANKNLYEGVAGSLKKAS